MELDWTTFLLEVINFLILVWLLKRFFYQPVLRVIEQRRQKIESELAQAAQGQEEAEALKQQYEDRLSDWEAEKRDALDQLTQQLAQERGKRLQQLDEELEQQHLKHQARDQQLQEQWRTQAETEALQLGSAFAARLLTSLSCPELDNQLQQLFIEQFDAMPESSVRALHEGWHDSHVKIEITSAQLLKENQQQTLRKALESRLGPSHGTWHFHHDEQLIAGLRVSIGGWMLHASLQDELRFFSEAAASHE